MVINHQVAIKATETVKAKFTLEREAQIQVVAIKIDLTDNGIFDASEFMEELLKKQKNVRFSGAGASNQNGATERAIKMVVTMERTMLIYAEIRCPHDTFYTDIWPMEMDDLELDYEWLTGDEHLPHFSKSGEKIVGRPKAVYSPLCLKQ